jgi:sugar/nucleoside kinase (ribokinase family)
MPSDVVVVGNIGIDTCVHGADHAAGAESFFTHNQDVIGQAGGYGARGFNRLGLKTAFIGHVGDDLWGRHILDTLKSEAIDTRCVWFDPQGTARSINIMKADGRRTNYYDGKGHMDMSVNLPLAEQVFREAKLAHVHIPNWSRQLLEPMRTAGLTISCDLQDVREFDDPYRMDFIAQADILFFSAANVAEPEAFAKFCFDHGPAQWVIAGMGAVGCAVATRDHIRMYPPVSLDLPIRDTNGAGDSLAAGFLWAQYFKGLDQDSAVKAGQLAARYCCSLTNGSDDLIRESKLQSYLNT